MKYFLGLLLAILPLCALSQTNYEPYTFTTLAGSVEISGSSNGIGSDALFSSPHGIATDAQNNVYVAEYANNTIRKITPAGVVTTVAGLAGSAGTNDGVGAAARFNSPYALTVDGAGNIFVADTHNDTVRVISPEGRVSTLAGMGGIPGTNDAVGSDARFYYPFGLALDKAGNLYVVDEHNQTIRKITKTGTVSTIAGLAGKTGSQDGTGGTARFNYPSAIVMNSEGVLFVDDEFNHTIRRVTTNGDVTTFAGKAGVHGLVDATGTNAVFYNPNGLAIDAADNLYVSEYLNDTVRKITPAGVVTTLAGWPQSVGNSNGTGSSVRFNNPRQCAVDGLGNLYVADFANDTIRKGWASGTLPVIQSSSPVLTNDQIQVGFTLLTGSSAAFQLLQSSQCSGPWTTNLDALLSTNVAGVFYTLTAPMILPYQFYRVESP